MPPKTVWTDIIELGTSMNTTGAYGSPGDLQRQNPWREFLGGRWINALI